METHDPRALLLTTAEVAARLGRGTAWVERARNASDSAAWPPPMAGWVNVGSRNKPEYRLPESVLIAYIASLPHV